MPLEKNFEHDRYGHLLSQPVVDNRKLSPKFPDVATAILRRQQHREMIAARALLIMTGVVGPLTMLGGHIKASSSAEALGILITVFGFIGFAATCLVAGIRAHKRSGGQGGDPFRS